MNYRHNRLKTYSCDTPFFLAGTFRPLQTTSDNFRPLQTTSINHVEPLQVPNAASTHHFKPLQPSSNEMLGVIKGSIIIYICVGRLMVSDSQRHCTQVRLGKCSDVFDVLYILDAYIRQKKKGWVAKNRGVDCKYHHIGVLTEETLCFL